MIRPHALLPIALRGFGAICCFFVPLAMLWPLGWAWHAGPPEASDYFMMIAGLYATLGIFLIRAARDPLANRSLIWFAVWSSLVHAAIMAVEAVRRPMQHGHLAGDVPALLLMAAVLALLLRRAERA